MMKLLLWLSYGEIMEVREGRNFGIPQDSMMHIWVFCGLPGCCFFFNGCLYYDAFSEVLKSLKGKKVLLNVQNIRADSFNLVKSLKNTCKWVYFFTKNERSQSFFFKILLTIFQRYCLLLITLSLRDTSHSFSVSSRLHLTQLSSFVDPKLIKLWINALNS